MKRQYVTVFPGRRDQYQIPVALAENGRLAGFATCFYWRRGIIGRIPAFAGILGQRRADGVDEKKVDCMEFTNIAARVGRRMMQPSKVGVWEDGAFARKAVALARRRQASLLLYEFQAEWAFRQTLRPGSVRILFQFHPHPALEHPLLLADGERYPQFLPGIRRNTRMNLAGFYRRHTCGAWRNADHVIAASRFTARSLEIAGCPGSRITVIPYGCDMGRIAGPSKGKPPIKRPYFLFVGSGTHRKGLHHLIEAWTRSHVSATHELVVIARVVDRELIESLATSKSVRHMPGVRASELSRWYASALAFVLPSLSEGFGHVYLEALACGCPVIGTRNSMLPDFPEAQRHVLYVEPGEPDSIRAGIERVAGFPAEDPFFRTEAVRESVKAYTWERFRGGVELVLAGFDR